MYKDHPVFEKPKDENIKIWRYLDFTKFISLLDKRALFFTRVDKLGDPFEGSSSKADIVFRYRYLKELEQKLPKDIFESISRLRSATPPLIKALRKFAVVNCWHINAVESSAMWKLYLKSEEGVAIRSSFKRLIKSFDVYKENDVFVGKVKYIDYDKDVIPISNIFHPFVHKRKSFQHEKELRAAIIKFPIINGQLDFTLEMFGDGIYVPVDLDVLIEKIYVSPIAEKWFKDLVESVMNRYDLKKEVVKSSLADDPVY